MFIDADNCEIQSPVSYWPHLVCMFIVQVASSGCSKDEPFIVFEEQLATEPQCADLCQSYSSTVIGCSFAMWVKTQGLGGKCVLYKEPFANYLAHCKQLSGPPDISGCSVDQPEESSCDGLR